LSNAIIQPVDFAFFAPSLRKFFTSMANVTYKSAGVDLELYDEAMRRLPSMMQRTFTPRVIPVADAFAGLMRLNHSSRPGAASYQDPVLVSGTDGVGTKLKVAQLVGKFDTVGIDLVAMSVNDVLCLGAEPLLFLDYLALGKDNPDLIGALVKGVSDGCVECGAALLGGETAIMPDIYHDGDFDMAGFCVGVAERTRLIDGKAIRPGDVVIGLPSSGFHSNGYSLIRKVVFGMAGLSVDHQIPELGKTVGEVLLEPTRLYPRIILNILKSYRVKVAISGLAHITGGGLKDNIERLLPEGCRLQLDRKAAPVPALFTWLQGLGSIERDEMYHVFNMGIGFTLIVRPPFVDSIRRQLTRAGSENWIVGSVKSGPRGVDYIS
jgi:phosphoribosylformylglycinamidine cyclo-ligase